MSIKTPRLIQDRCGVYYFRLIVPLSWRHIRKAPNAARRAKKLGHTDIRVMSTGITGWTDAGLPVEGAN